MKPRGILFDLDGTLVDTAPEAALALNKVLEPRGLGKVSADEVRPWFGLGAAALLAQALAARQGPDGPLAAVDLMPAFSDHYAALSGRASVLYPGVAEALRALRTAGLRLGLVTNKDARFARPVLAAHGLAACFEPALFGDTLAVRKPDAGIVQHCLEAWKLAPDEVLLIGDSEIDVQTARAGGIAVWLVGYGYTRGGPPAAAGADRVIDSVAGILAAFQDA